MDATDAIASATKTGSAWISERTSDRAAAQQSFALDPKYKKYTQQVEKCLNSFDDVHEWADCIAFLKQLLKTFQSYSQFKEIPRKLIVAKRLSQCLNPALPTGVHQRALDVYSHLLTVIGSEGLHRDLPLWSSGLFPFFEYSATSVKPTLLNIYETYYLPLQTGLRPVMKSMILALLPGLEEETGEFFEKVLSLMDRLSGTVSLSFFFQNIWLVMLTTPSARGTALNLLTRRLPRFDPEEDITPIVGRDIGLMIRAFAAALEDENLLVRRSALDLLVQSIKLDSTTVHKAQADDRAILMRAAVGVVLRRDLSLNRRLYTWLLGPDEKPESQVAHLKQHSLELLRSTLHEDMFSPSGEYSESRPFKIFISLLDKWEIGGPLTEVLVLDAFKALKGSLATPSDSAEDITMTASSLYEAVEPQILWRQLLSSIISELSESGTTVEAIKLAQFILSTFMQDAEIQSIHLPVVFLTLTDSLDRALERTKAPVTRAIKETLVLLKIVLQTLPPDALLRWPELPQSTQQSDDIRTPQAFAHVFYDIPLTTVPSPPSRSFTPAESTLDNMNNLVSVISLELAKSQRLEGGQVSEVLCLALDSLHRLVERLSAPVRLAWVPAEWMTSLLSCMEHPSSRFNLTDRIISLLISLHQNNHPEPALSIDHRPTMVKVVKFLLGFLRPETTAYHSRVVNLLWDLKNITIHPHVESIISQSMTSTDARGVQAAYEAFGVLWRLTDDHLLPGFHFRVPMMAVLDALKSEDPTLHRISESWMRCSLKSYLRVLDPLIFDLIDPTITRTPAATKVSGREILGFSYEQPFNQRLAHHLLEMVLSITKFGGQGFVKTIRNTPINRSYHPGLIQRVAAGGFPDNPSYLDILVDVLLRFLQSEPTQQLQTSMMPVNILTQAAALEMLQAIVMRGELDSIAIQVIEAVVVGKLYYSIHNGRLDLQNKLLHLLHSLVSAGISLDVALQQSNRLVDANSKVQDEVDPSPSRYPVNPLLIQTLVDGISHPTNRPILQHWLDFILMAIPQFQPVLQSVIIPLNDCLCRQLLTASSLIKQASSSEPDDFHIGDFALLMSDAEMVMLLNGLERMILLALADTSETGTADEEPGSMDKAPPESSGMLGYVSGMFGSESAQQNQEQLTARSAGYRSLHEGVKVLYTVWGHMTHTAPEIPPAHANSLPLICTRTRARSRKVLEHLFRVHSAEVFETLVDCWSQESSPVPDYVAFELVDILIANAQSVVHLVCESISCRITSGTEKMKKQVVNPDLTDIVFYQFLEEYFRRLEGPLAIQVWARFIQFVKDIISGARDFRPQNFYTLRCLTVLAEKITHTSAIEDRRMRKDIQDSFGKLLDSCVIFSGRAFDSGSWIRRGLTTNGRDSPSPRDDKLTVQTPTLPPNSPGLGGATSEVLQINDFIAKTAIPNMRRLFGENDKMLLACTNIVYYIVSPAMKSRNKPMDMENTLITILQEMCRIPATLRAWKVTVTEVFSDARFFNASPTMAERWRPIIRSLFEVDKTALPELLTKTSTAPTANIFTSKEYEMLLRSLNLRRLAFALLTNEKNHFLTLLPSIQEKLVDTFKNMASPAVLCEVYLCIRVLLCRLSPHNLTSFWPVILTELYRLFDNVMSNLPSDGSEELPHILAASKCLDLLIVLQTQEFQIHQWIFITDTVDAIYRPNDWFPEAVLDQLAELAGNLPRTEPTQIAPSPAAHNLSFGNRRLLRQPILASIRQVDSIRDLLPFFASVSISSYESVYASGGNVDWESIEKGLVDDMFDGR